MLLVLFDVIYTVYAKFAEYIYTVGMIPPPIPVIPSGIAIEIT